LKQLFVVGTCGLLGTDDLLACFVAGNALNWDGEFLEETERRHDEVNSCIDVLLNFGGFMYIGSILPWDEFNQPEETGITYGRLVGLGILVLILRRIPAIFAMYKFMPKVCKNWKEALFMGYFGPIGKRIPALEHHDRQLVCVRCVILTAVGIGAVFYVEHSRHLFPEPGEGDPELDRLVRAAPPGK
jgi:sodium/hydrogen antiporter